ncbi:hypothetical protein GQ43DRAFT_455992 [Delitschia confertaspora ATCC 74209]|uniref:Flavin reductase like domain-containing protein n=1 Tax=Delitschia confertaspora ATCC 74209 TaxID=1513339 RepID=A0A9P4JL13_9PLEO|nr:hypothetical protein GQ43DRAFT_455992 [Delitschia confertaspora ATCC 74209]
MFYEPGKTDHGLPHDPFKACVTPRPIGWISTLSSTGIANLAPYSQFNNLTFDPPYVMFSANQTPSNTQKDTVANVETTGVFVWNLATWELKDAVNVSARQVPEGVDEFELTGVEAGESRVVKVDVEGRGQVPVPMVKKSPIQFECTYHSTIRLPGHPPMGTADIVIGKVVGIHISDDVLTNGKVDVKKTEPIARLGYFEYAVVRGEGVFEMTIPVGEGEEGEGLLVGLEGCAKGNRRHGRDYNNFRKAPDSINFNRDYMKSRLNIQKNQFETPYYRLCCTRG